MAVIRSRPYIVALVLAAILGVPISAAAYGFLALVTWLQGYLFTDLPTALVDGKGKAFAQDIMHFFRAQLDSANTMGD